MLSLLSSVLNIFTKILPFIFAFKAGKDNAQKKELEQAVKNTQERNKIENEVNRMSDDVVIKRLRKRWRRGDVL
jgi:methyl coenzyme M reductase subunit D|tara:strand:+ start:263 stop:484 length:222 start_codon:yes stop_codon:yes gene_type:complete